MAHSRLNQHGSGGGSISSGGLLNRLLILLCLVSGLLPQVGDGLKQ